MSTMPLRVASEKQSRDAKSQAADNDAQRNLLVGWDSKRTKALEQITGGERLNLLTASPPCQSASVAGKQRGSGDHRWFWPETLAAAAIFKPRWLVFENVYGFVGLNNGMELDTVLSDLESIGYAARPFIIPACGVDAPHRRNRVWIVGHSAGGRRFQCDAESKTAAGTLCAGQDVAHGKQPGLEGYNDGDASAIAAKAIRTDAGTGGISDGHCRWEPEPGFCRVAHGVPQRVHRLKALGNAIVPQVAYPILKAIYDIDNALVTSDEST
jgi:DNA (cytosine-5)-methyltransferase 1